ncbi:hypothetical protein [Sphingopyxis sp.]|uniref:hypothetical protein n=1 Tax=Sphingopyxis sp. TaxID=1908224 RepID=UPI003D0D10A2
MTVRKFGQGRWLTALPLATAMIAAGASVSATAQQTETPAPTPAPSSIFRLPPADDGRAPGVQGPSDNGLPPVAPNERRGQNSTPTPTPTPLPSQPATPPRVATTQSTSTISLPTPPAARGDAPATVSRAAPSSDPAAPTQAAPEGSVLLPLPSAAPDSAAAPTLAPPVAEAGPITAPGAASSGVPLWAWLLALLAALGAGFWYWRRRTALAGPAVDDTPAPPPAPAARSAVPPTRPVEPQPTPRPAAPVPPMRRDEPRAASPLVTRAAGEQRALVAMTLDIRSIRFAADHVAVGFALHLLNQGSLPATGLMVRIALNQGSAMPEAVLGRFFDGAGGSVLRDDMMLGVGSGEDLSTEVMLPRAAIEPLIIGGKPMLVPVIALDVTYHWDGEGEAFGQNAASFVLGREQGTSGSDKLAPLALDRAAYLVDRPGARATAIKRSQ